MKGTLRLRVGTLLPTAAALLILAVALAVAATSEKVGESRPDVIRIDSMAAFGELERAAVTFYHDRHTDAAKKMGKDCSACHLKTEAEGDKLSLKYMRLADTDKTAVMNAYHDNCIACHKEAADRDMKTGPVACNQCHDAGRAATAARMPAGMDLSLHYRHDKAMAGKCESCHHAYDETAKRLFYDKGKEGSCRYCHGEATTGNRIAFRFAAHMDCIACHRQKIAENKVAGPLECRGCHGAEAQELWEKVADPPPPKRGQPADTLVAVGNGGRMGRVAFDHLGHQRSNDTCRVCHHKEIAACNTCHSVDGKREGAFVTLEKAMHEVTREASCVGCHDRRQSARQCIGCHGTMEKRRLSQDACLTCHEIPPGAVAETADVIERTAVAVITRMTRPRAVGTYPPEEIPEVVEIASLTDQYEPVRMPHRRIVDKMMAGIGDDRLAGVFHRTQGTVCQGCHHNSPAQAKPPKCASCHAVAVGQELTDVEKPALLGAYHQQCMGCHDAMGIEKPDRNNCIGCHILRKKW